MACRVGGTHALAPSRAIMSASHYYFSSFSMFLSQSSLLCFSSSIYSSHLPSMNPQVGVAFNYKGNYPESLYQFSMVVCECMLIAIQHNAVLQTNQLCDARPYSTQRGPLSGTVSDFVQGIGK